MAAYHVFIIVLISSCSTCEFPNEESIDSCDIWDISVDAVRSHERLQREEHGCGSTSIDEAILWLNAIEPMNDVTIINRNDDNNQLHVQKC